MLKTFSNLYMASKVADDAIKLLGTTGLIKALKDVEFDREYWLNKVGLTRQNKGSRAFGGISLFVLGAVAGGVGALLFATKTGPEFRTQVRERALDLRDRAKDLVQRNSSTNASPAERASSLTEPTSVRAY